ncbi:MAG: hypothetical protein K2J64_03745 [Desulfovibrio sp.]|nr:hypothetical protein [Desulfovibrio sp.]
MDSCVAKIPRAAKDGAILVGEGVKFERIRRIALLSMPVRLALLANGHGASRRHSVATGYLVGTLDRFAPAVGESPSLTDGDSGIVARLFHYLTAVSIRSFLRRNGWSNDAKRAEERDRVQHCGCSRD